MATQKLKRYGIERVAKVMIAAGLLLLFISWLAGLRYYEFVGKAVLIVPLLFTLVSILLLLVIRYRYTLFERYPYLMNLPSLFYRVGKQKGKNNQSIAFRMIFTVHSLSITFIGLLSLILTISIGSSIGAGHHITSTLYVYFATIIIFVVSVLFLYRRIYIRFVK